MPSLRVAAIENIGLSKATMLWFLGDSAATAGAVGRQVGLMSEPATKPPLVLHTPAFMSRPEYYQVDVLKNSGNIIFSRAKPLDKLHLVSLLQENCSDVVAMTGDGVNDASALHKVCYYFLIEEVEILI